MTINTRPATARLAGLAALCVAGAVALPATASAASPASIVAGPLKVKGYSMTLTATDAAKDSMSVMFVKRAGKASQTHFYSFASGVNVTSSRISGSLGKYGKVDLKLAGVGAAKRGITPKGCTGKAGTVRRGALKGTFKLVADSTYFKTVSARSLKGQVARGGKIDCAGGGGNGGANGDTAGATTLTATKTDADGMLMLSVTKDAGTGAVTQQAIRNDDAAAAAPASVMHMISAPGTSSAFAPAADLSSATGSGISPFFSGAFSFASEMPMEGMSTGTLTGDLAAKFDSIGTQQFAGDAMLMSR